MSMYINFDETNFQKLCKTQGLSRVVVVHTFNPSTQEAEAGGSLGVRGQPGLQSEFQDSQGYIEKSSLEKPPPSKKVIIGIKHNWNKATLSTQDFA